MTIETDLNYRETIIYYVTMMFAIEQSAKNESVREKVNY